MHGLTTGFFAHGVDNMAEQKAVPLNVVVSDKGKKAVRIGKAFYSADKMPTVSLTIDMAALNDAIKKGTVTEQEYAGNEKYPDPVLDHKKVLRMACFKIEKKA